MWHSLLLLITMKSLLARIEQAFIVVSTALWILMHSLFVIIVAFIVFIIEDDGSIIIQIDGATLHDCNANIELTREDER